MGKKVQMFTLSDWGRDFNYGGQEKEICSYVDTAQAQATPKAEDNQGVGPSNQGEESQAGRAWWQGLQARADGELAHKVHHSSGPVADGGAGETDLLPRRGEYFHLGERPHNCHYMVTHW